MKYILYTQILQDIIFNHTFKILISQILYQYTKLHINATLGIKSIYNSISQILYQYTELHINATLGIKSIYNSISQILYQYTELHINATLGIKSIHNLISQISKTIQFNLNL